MQPANAARLFEAAPSFFVQQTPASCPFDYWGFEIDDGWFEPVLKMAIRIQAVVGKLPNAEDFRCHQLKSKYAGLRCYTGESHPEIEEAIEEAAAECSKMCEACGKAGKRVNPAGWVFVFCREHFDRHVEQVKPSKTPVWPED